MLKLLVRLLWRLFVLDPVNIIDIFESFLIILRISSPLLEDPEPEQEEATTRLTLVGLESSLLLLPTK